MDIINKRRIIKPVWGMYYIVSSYAGYLHGSGLRENDRTRRKNAYKDQKKLTIHSTPFLHNNSLSNFKKQISYIEKGARSALKAVIAVYWVMRLFCSTATRESLQNEQFDP